MRRERGGVAKNELTDRVFAPRSRWTGTSKSMTLRKEKAI